VPEHGTLLNTLKEPLGKIIQEQDLLQEISDDDVCIVIGDESAYTLYRLGFKLKLAIIDYQTQRKARPELKVHLSKIGDKVIKVDNPQGMITGALWTAVKNALEDDSNVRIEINGEEDLATIPCVALAPLNTVIIYGMPEKGLVVARVDEHSKELVKKAIEMMETVQE
jgi:uncharacterized protein (UPF0218 family)